MSLERVPEPVRRLATVVSLAARIEPELLRAARLRLLPDVDVSAEADLWFSGLVAARSTRRIVLEAEVAAELQEELKRNRPLLDAAREVVTRIHAEAPPAIQLEEELTYLALTGEDVEESIETKLTAVLNAIANEGRSGLIDWAARALPRMPELVGKTKAAAALRLVTGGGAAGAELHVRREVLDDPALAALVERALPKTTVYARLVPGEYGVSVEIGRTAMPASHPLELPKTEPLVLELTTASQSEVVEVPREGTLVRSIADDVAIRTIARDVYRLEEQRAHAGALRLLALTRLGMGELVLDDLPDADLVLIAGDVTETAEEQELVRMSDQLRRHFRQPVFAVAGPHDVIQGHPTLFGPFERFVERLGFGRIATRDNAKTFVLGNWSVGVAGIYTPYGDDPWRGSFESTQIVEACGGDPAAWCRSHDLAILVMHHGPQHLGQKSQERWESYRAADVFDLIVYGSGGDEPHRLRNGALLVGTPQLTNPERPGYVSIEIAREGDSLLVTTRRQWGEHAEWRMRLPARQRVEIVDEKSPRRRVLVAGIAEQLSVPVQELCRAIGGLLALQGHELLTGGWAGVDYLVAEGFERVARKRVAEALTHYLPAGKQSDFPRGRQIARGSDQESRAAAVAAADVVVLIEGASGTFGVGQEALRQGKPLIPIGAGAAADIRDAAMHAWPPEAHERLQRLAHRSGIAATVGVVRELVLNAASPWANTEASAAGKRVFLSYHRDDDEFVRAFVEQAAQRLPEVEFWHDETTLASGSSWSEEIDSAIRASAAAVVFVSASYLASRTLSNFELQRLIEAAQEREFPLTWFLARPSRYEESAIIHFQAAHDVSRPLDALGPKQRREIYARMADDLVRAVASGRGFDEQARELVMRQIGWAIALEEKLEGPTEANLPRAIASYEIALSRIPEPERRSPEWSTLRERLVAAYERLGRTYETLQDYPKAVATYQSAARLFADLGMAEKSREAAERAATLAPPEA